MIAELINNQSAIAHIVSQTFVNDNELFENFHLINGNPEASIHSTVGRILEIIESKNLKGEFYQLLGNYGELIGYYNICAHSNLLHSFGLCMKHRNTDMRKKLFESIKKHFSDFIICGLYAKNIRATKYLKKLGFELHSEITDEEVNEIVEIYKYNF